MALIVCCFAAAGSRVSLTGGLYAYVEVAFGPFVGFLAGVLYQLMAAFAVASVASAFTGSVGALWAPVATPAGRAVVLVVLFAVLATVNVRGVTFGARLVEAVTLAKAASRVLGSGGRLLVVGGAIVSMFGYVAGDMLGSPRSLYAFGRDGMLPAALARVHPRFHTPHVAIVTYAMLIAALAISSSFTQLAILANVAGLTLYLTCVAASYELQR